jgi:hypothetical protein
MVEPIKGTERVELIVRSRAGSLSIAVAVMAMLTSLALVIGAPRPAGAEAGPPPTPSANYQMSGGYNGPCANPAAVTATCPAGLSSIDVARANEGVVPMSLPTNFATLTDPEQVFVLTNLERVDRGLPPISGLSSALDADGQAGVAGNADPPLPAGATASGNWGESPNLFSTVEMWMYQDGWEGSATFNAACTSPSAPGCWGHRDNILGTYASPSLMGAAAAPVPAGTSVAEVIVASDTTDTPYFTWADVMAHLPVGVTDASVDVSSPPGASQVGSVQVWASGEAMNVGLSISGGKGVFSMGSPSCSMAVGHSCQAAINFAPPSVGEYTATLSVSGPNGVQNVPLVGVASRGYRLVASDGGIFSFGGASFLGSTGAIHLNRPIVGMADDQQTGGYWLVASDGGIFSFGAPFDGSAGGLGLTSPVVGMAATPDGGGYWLVTASGGVFSFGDATFHGAAAGLGLTSPVVGIVATPDGGGYWLANAAGGVFSFGDAKFFGSAGALHLNKPVVGMAATPDGGGYWLVASDGGIFNYGDAAFDGSTGAIALNKPVVGMAPTPDGGGYWLVASDGGVFNFGDAAFYGSTGAMRLNSPVVGLVVGQP